MKPSSFVLLILLLFSLLFIPDQATAQLQIGKRIGKDASGTKPGFGTFADIDIPLNEYMNRMIRVELVDLMFYPKAADNQVAWGYLAIKLGYKYLFSEDNTGFYLAPQFGYARVVAIHPEETDARHGDGVGGAFEAGYAIGVGQQYNTISIGLKYETDYGGKDLVMNTIALRVAFNFLAFQRR